MDRAFTVERIGLAACRPMDKPGHVGYNTGSTILQEPAMDMDLDYLTWVCIATFAALALFIAWDQHHHG